MLLEFTVGNYLSFKDKKTLSFEATQTDNNVENVLENGQYKLLSSLAIFGANSSGKSNLLKSFQKMLTIINSSGIDATSEESAITPFLLNTETEKQPSYFEFLILIDGIRYRYGFEISCERVHYEWLFERKSINKEKTLFIREDDSIVINNFIDIQNKILINSLFLSTACSVSVTGQKILGWCRKSVFISQVPKDERHYRLNTINLMKQNSEFSREISKFIKTFDLGFKKITLSSSGNNIITVHNKYNKNNKIVGTVELSALSQESEGTNKLLNLVGYFIEKFESGGLIIIDEFDAKFHLLVTKFILSLFSNSSINIQNAQLIFTSHNISLLNFANLRRDQIYFTEKNQYGESDLYSLVEYIEDQNYAIDYSKEYISGRYGAIPMINNYFVGTTEIYNGFKRKKK